MRVLIVGVSARALAESVARAGLVPVAVDAFADTDLGACSAAVERARPWTPDRVLAAARRLAWDAAAYTGGLENHPRLVGRLAARGELLGNPAAVLARVRDWPGVARRLAAAGFRAPAGLPAGAPAPAAGCWLLKPRGSAGGHGIGLAAPGQVAGAGQRLEAYVPGAAWSALFLAAAGRGARLLGVTEQLIGRPELGAGGFAYCGNILLPAVPPDLRSQLEHLVRWLALEYSLIGLCGVDFILAEGRAVALEVNPRWTAAMELLEWAADVSLFPWHCAGVHGDLPPGPALASGYFGKAVLYTRVPAVWRGEPRGNGHAGGGAAPDRRAGRWLRDRPHPGEMLRPGPVCTILARGETRSACWQRLLELAETVRRECLDGAPDLERGAVVGPGGGHQPG